MVRIVNLLQMNLQVQVFRGDIECRMIRKDKNIREDKKKEERRNEYSEMYLIGKG